MADGRSLKKFLTKHRHFELYKDDQNREKVKCKLTGHELPARLSDLENYIKGKKYQRLTKEVPDKSPGYEEYKEFLVPSEKNRNQLYCQLTKKYINNAPHHIQRHVMGKHFGRALEKHHEKLNMEAEEADEDMWVPSDLESESELEEEEESEKKEEDEDDSGGEFSSEGTKDHEKLNMEAEEADEDMWVPSDLESESELEEEEESEKKEEDEDDSGGEFSSEDEEDPYERKEDGLKRTLKKTNETKATKKVKASAGPKLIKQKDIKQPKETKAKKSSKT
ncbi:surfeit locus protein 2-like isoform X3 [Orbicella faveolata]|uniref:surfeit locus protein 2-like isoform X3 n=1 Tax=Orbicella faveolata TaxID=48498 RepID=UPI0009E52D05|nr:surfeit locus protein 2-like isoform X3 [Orbicella faveolata]